MQYDTSKKGWKSKVHVPVLRTRNRKTLKNSDSGCAEKPHNPIHLGTNHFCRCLPQSKRDPKHHPQAFTLSMSCTATFRFTLEFLHFDYVFSERLPHEGGWHHPTARAEPEHSCTALPPTAINSQAGVEWPPGWQPL